MGGFRGKVEERARNAVHGIGALFRTRTPRYTFAHLDIVRLAKIIEKLSSDPYDPIALQYRDHGLWINVLDLINEFKTFAKANSGFPADMAFVSLGRKILSQWRGRNGKTVGLDDSEEEDQKLCCICKLPGVHPRRTVKTWRRGPENQDDVVCDDQECLDAAETKAAALEAVQRPECFSCQGCGSRDQRDWLSTKHFVRLSAVKASIGSTQAGLLCSNCSGEMTQIYWIDTQCSEREMKERAATNPGCICTWFEWRGSIYRV